MILQCYALEINPYFRYYYLSKCQGAPLTLAFAFNRYTNITGTGGEKRMVIVYLPRKAAL